MELHLRLLALALRLYKYGAKSLESTLHVAVYDGITRLGHGFERYRKNRVKVDDWNVAFLLKHCQYIVLSIENSDSFQHKAAKRAIVAFDAGLGSQYHELRPALAEIIKRQRSRPDWHDEYMGLEDAVYAMVRADVRYRNGDNLANVLEVANLATRLLRNSIETQLMYEPKPSRIQTFFRHVIGKLTSQLQESGAYEEHSNYLGYGVLDLIYHLSFRVPKRFRRNCFEQFLKVVRMSLEQSQSVSLHLKAQDIWNRISELEEKDEEIYGDPEDHVAIKFWIIRHFDVELEEGIEYSSM
jgi:hypothetical protein